MDDISRLVHGFTAERSLSFSADPTDPAWDDLAARAGFPAGQVALVRQVHGHTVKRVSAPGLAGDGDALITDQVGLLLTIRVADCVPILLCGPGRQIAAVHSGWRGTAANIVAATIRALGGPPTAAVIGPCISTRRYEVGEEVVDGIRAAGVPDEVFVRRDLGERPHVDLRAAITWQLHQSGVTAVSALPQCAFEDERLHSFRRDREQSGRMAAFIGWLR